MTYSKLAIIILIIFLPIIGLFLLGKQLIAATLFIIGLLISPLVISLRKMKFNIRELVILSLIGTIAALFRIPFAMLPSVQPTTFIIIATAIVIGSQGGFVIGLLAAFISNLYLGHGPWTLFQMLAWSLIGFYAGLLRQTIIMRTVIGRAIYGFVTGILFGWFMNLSFIIFIVQTVDLKVILPYYVASFPFDLNHAITNSVLLLVLSTMWIKLIESLTSKYNLFKNR